MWCRNPLIFSFFLCQWCILFYLYAEASCSWPKVIFFRNAVLLVIIRLSSFVTFIIIIKILKIISCVLLNNQSGIYSYREMLTIDWRKYMKKEIMRDKNIDISICYESIVQLLKVHRNRKEISWIHIILYQ